MTATHGISDVKIKNSHCGICGSDLHTIESDGVSSTCLCVVGHGIVGELTLAGPDVEGLKVSDRVDVGAQVWSCLNKDPSPPCKECSGGDDASWAHKAWAYNGTYKNDGSTSHGSYADYVRVPHKYAFKIPSDVAAPLLCAGATVLAPLKEAGAKPGKGVGFVSVGDLGHLGVPFADDMDADAVVAFSRSANKKQKVGDLCATECVVDRNEKQAATVICLADIFRSSYAKVLGLVALLMCVAARAATSAWIPHDITRMSRAVMAAHTPVQTKRNLRLNGATQERSYNFDETTDIAALANMVAELTPEMKQTLEKALPTGAELEQAQIDGAAVKVIDAIMQPLKDIKDLEIREALYDNYIKLLAEKFDDATLARLLAAGVNTMETVDVAKDLQRLHVRHWQKKTAAEVIKLLKDGTPNGQLFKNPLFDRLAVLVQAAKTAPPDKIAAAVYPTLYSTLSRELTDDDLVKTLVEGTITAGEDNHLAPNLLLMHLLKGKLDGKYDETWGKLVEADKARTRYGSGGLHNTWLKTYFFFIRGSKDLSDLTQLKLLFGESKVAEMLATTDKATEVLKERAQLLRNEQFREWKAAKLIVKDVEKKLKDDGITDEVIKKIVDDYKTYTNIHVARPVPILPPSL